MRSRASQLVFAPSRWIVLLACIVSSRVLAAQNATESAQSAFESAFGLNVPESIENQSAERADGSRAIKSPEAPLEIDDLAVDDKNSSTVAKTDEGIWITNRDDGDVIQFLPGSEEVKNVLTRKQESGGADAPSGVQGRMAGEKNGKYVRYGK